MLNKRKVRFDWKNFLKPTPVKIVLFIIFFLMSPARLVSLDVPQVVGQESSTSGVIPIFGGWKIISDFIIAISLSFEVGSPVMLLTIFIQFDLILLFFSLAGSYILSCLVFYLYSIHRR